MLSLITFQFAAAFAQQGTEIQQEFDKLANAYHSSSITKDQYLFKVDSLTHQLLSGGKHFETTELADLLSLYEEISWHNPGDAEGRVSYYFLFLNNARLFKKRGASIYYAEKVTEEYKKYGETHPLVEQLQKCKIYQELRLYDKMIDLYQAERNYLDSLPELLQQGLVDPSVGLNAMYILSPVLEAYTNLNDTAGVYQTAHLGKEIGEALQRKYPIGGSQMLYNDLLVIHLAHSVANFEHRYERAGVLLDQMEALKIKYKDQATDFIDLSLIRLRIENYFDRKNLDSVSHYIKKYESSSTFNDGLRAEHSELRGRLQELKGDYRGAYASATAALKLEREVQSALMTESSDLLYAYTQAEHSAIALQRAEHVKQQRTVWLVIISAVASIIVLLIYFIMLRRSRKAKQQIETLNEMANMQVIAMEEAKHQAVREEQQRLGQDLHDGLSSSIASIRHQLEMLSMDTDDAALKHKLGTLQSAVATAYETARNKSHEWFSAANEQDEQSFEQRIKLLTDSALPDSRYQKDIQIDDHSLLRVNADTRIALLRIIQEAITNIIKHAKATTVDILIYEEMDSLLLTIKDDGKGMANIKSKPGKSNMGLQSIRRRVQYLHGDVSIQSAAEGMEITVSIPLIPPVVSIG